MTTRATSSAHRGGCLCGAIRFLSQADPAAVDANLGSLDRPESVAPRHHVFTSSRIAWFETADALPRFEGGLPEQPRA